MINITQSPSDFHPAYNDSYISFTTTFTEDDRAVITLNNQYQFTLFPDNSGEYLFNMREVVKSIINESQFKDTLDNSNANWGFIDYSLFRSISVNITVYGDNISESVSNTYRFNKAVKQYGDKELTNPYQLMLPSEDGINYHLTYFEGYPMEFPFRFLPASVVNIVSNPDGTITTTYSNEITIKNLRTGEITTPFRPITNAPYRLFIDKGYSNWNTSGVLGLTDMINRLSVRAEGVQKATIELTKKTNECGKYLKWFNADGSYSYWLFNQFYKQEHVGNEIDRINTNNFSNIYDNQEGQNKITGKSGGSSIKLKTQVDENGKNHLISLITSPFVQLWSESEPYKSGKWLNVKLVSKGFTYVNKKRINQLEVEIELPEVNTQTL